MRIQLDFPDQFLFETVLTVRATDLNYGAHVGNDTILAYMQEARVLFYRSLGFKDELTFEESVGQIITDSAIQYKSEAFLGDQLVIRIAVTDFNKYGFDMLYQITNQETGRLVTIGKTGIVCFDYTKRKIASIPNVLLKALTY
jgi:acyl-CoA thioester hydrolase